MYVRKPVLLPKVPQNCWFNGALLKIKVEIIAKIKKPTNIQKNLLARLTENFHVLKINPIIRKEIEVNQSTFIKLIGSKFVFGETKIVVIGPTESRSNSARL